MPALHAHFLLRNQQAFQRLLDASRTQASGSNASASGPPTLSSSAGRSWTRPSALGNHDVASGQAAVDVNARDWLGRTVLHLAVSAPASDAAALEYVKLLLAHPRIDVNAPDAESRWTPLHRALYEGNLPACVLLLQRADVDTSLKDYEGYTPFDVYNSTVEGTKPSIAEPRDLYTWGTNRNAALGIGDGDDRANPDLVSLPPLLLTREHPAPSTLPLSSRFASAHVEQVAMAKLHTAVVATESEARITSLRLCGVGSGGRLGPISQHTQFALAPLRELAGEAPVAAVALGPDHTLVLTRAGAVLSWGLNRFAQLGYAVDGTGSLQTMPRRVVGPLKRETVMGVAACRMASACWTASDVYTWGTNGGQLGYDKVAQPVQVLPRRVTQVTQPVVDIAMSDTAMAVLLASRDVLCFYNGRNFKINFPTQNFPSEIQAYRPPMAQNNADIAKVVNCENNFAALSSNGEIFTFTLNAPSAADSVSSQPKGTGVSSALVKPQRLWALRKQFSAVRDVALGADGTVVLCTESGHVYVRSRLGKGGSFKFTRMPGLQRVVRIAASGAGAFAALRAECAPSPVTIAGTGVARDVERVRPWVVIPGWQEEAAVEAGSPRQTSPRAESDVPQGAGSPVDAADLAADEESAEAAIAQDVKTVTELLDILEQDRMHRRLEAKGLYDRETEPLPRHWRSGVGAHGSDLLVHIGDSEWSAFDFPAHTIVFAARSKVLRDVLSGQPKRYHTSTVNISISATSSPSSEPTLLNAHTVSTLTVSGVHPLSVLLLATYLYSDDVPALWDSRVATDGVSTRLRELAFPTKPKSKAKPSVGLVHTELQALARLLQLPALEAVLALPYKRACVPCAARDLGALFAATQEIGVSISNASTNADAALGPLAADTVLELADKTVYAHSAVLRARSPFFAGFFDEPDWTMRRRQKDGAVHVALRHMRWQAVEYVMRYVYEGGGEELFDVLDFVQNVDEVLEFMFEVMDVASELLLDPLLLICSSVVLKFITITNVCSVLADAVHFHAHALIASLHGYIAHNIETLLESHALDDLPMGVIRGLSAFVRARQAEKFRTTRSGVLVATAAARWADWIAEQDIPHVVIPCRAAGAGGRVKQSPRISPIAVATPGGKRSRPSPSLGQTPDPAPSSSPLVTQRFTPPLAAAPIREDECAGSGAADDIFAMDDDGPSQEHEREEIPPLSLPAARVTMSAPAQPSAPAAGTYSPWKARVTAIPPAPRADLRAIMAEAKASGRRDVSSTPIGTPPSGRPRASGYESDQAHAPRTPQKSAVDKTNGPWRQLTPASATTLGPSAAVTTAAAPSVVRQPSGSASLAPSGLSRALQGDDVQRPPAAPLLSGIGSGSGTGKPALGLGPTYSPMRQPSSFAAAAPMARRVSEGTGKPWASVTSVFPPSPTLAAQPSTSSVSPPSFLAIQNQQRDQADKASSSKAKSLIEIQEEERVRQAEAEEADRARREEAEFMRWWAAEEERIRRETQARPGPRVTMSAGQGASEGGRGGARKGRSAKRKEKERVSESALGETSADPAPNQERGGQRPQRPRRPRGKAPAVNAQPQQV